MARQALGRSDLRVSRLALGSWRTFERISREDGLAVMRAAREHGFNFLDDARYDDETGAAPMRTGYSEVLFGELFRAAGWDRADTVVANKLWWEFWPGQTAADELDGSLGRMGLDYVDLIYANPPPAAMPVAEMVASVAGLVTSGKARAWGIVNWEAGPFAEAVRAAEEQGVAPPCAAQLPYSVVHRDWVESEEMTAALEAGGSGRASAQLDDPRHEPAREMGRRLRELASELGASPAALAIAFALANPRVASVLFGATSPAQIAENVAALEVDAAAVQRITD
jgi:aryl-alcohol dehydrogenase-like predicted oxidoreductase